MNIAMIELCRKHSDTKHQKQRDMAVVELSQKYSKKKYSRHMAKTESSQKQSNTKQPVEMGIIELAGQCIPRKKTNEYGNE